MVDSLTIEYNGYIRHHLGLGWWAGNSLANPPAAVVAAVWPPADVDVAGHVLLDWR